MAFPGNTQAPAPSDPLAGDPTLTFAQHLGTGSFGNVALYLRNAPGLPPEYVAVKYLPCRQVDYSLIKREVKSHCSLNHPHVVLFKRLGLTPDRRFLYMVRLLYRILGAT